jgi:NAD(P)-dependent dehydrogenase (short-subunit alcohol dehydrogenase family)
MLINARAEIKGGGRGLGLGFVRQLLARPRYSRVIAAARTYDARDSANELAQLVNDNQDRLTVVSLKEIGDVDRVLVRSPL